VVDVALDANPLRQVAERLSALPRDQVAALEERPKTHGQDPRRDIVDTTVKVALNVSDDLHASRVHFVTQLVGVHARQAAGESVPRFHYGAVPTSALLKAPNLVVSRVVQDELPAPRRIDATKALETDEAAVDGLTLDLGAVTIELKDGRLHPAHVTRSEPRSAW
jgi:hypothetical protein